MNIILNIFNKESLNLTNKNAFYICWWFYIINNIFYNQNDKVYIKIYL